MTCSEIVREIQQLPLREQHELHETLGQLLKEQESDADSQHCQSTNVASAARALLVDYQTDSELTAFAALDADDFHEAR